MGKQIKKAKNLMGSKLMGGNYGFIKSKNMLNGEYTHGHIDYIGTNWVTTGDLKYGKNHCAATVGSNIALYYSNLGYRDLRKEKDEHGTFGELYKIIGNGPILFLRRKLKSYFKDRGYNLKYKTHRSFEKIKVAIKNNRPCAVLLSASPENWHWVMVIGFREYKTGEKYLQILDSWNKNENNFYKMGQGGVFILATEYWIDKT